MAVKEYHKLVRDRIPEIIEKQGQTCVCETLSDSDYRARLNDKLREEVAEYLESGEVEELCDVAEVLRAILAVKGVSYEAFEAKRLEKRARRGGFEKRLLLVEVDDD